MIDRPPGIGQRLAFHGFSGNIPGFLRALIACANKSFTTQVVVHRLFEVLDGTLKVPAPTTSPGWLCRQGGAAGWGTVPASPRS
ncbi:hypothetical protein [Synechococcus sp. CBW1006]|uniref:hypothetical protein n=1 Tax=Synechococcus sp. CBW1006 TaxID=1353138 RepID=UPI0018CE75DC|nr:hypothetical protein [Synechococcus sp. CBW1006]QPN65652.1 hypothetical protein H8F26_12070 [Synechococcus sp. CBW1006]